MKKSGHDCVPSLWKEENKLRKKKFKNDDGSLNRDGYIEITSMPNNTRKN